MIVDDNLHWYPDYFFSDESFLHAVMRLVPRGYGEYAELSTVPETGKRQIVISKPKGHQNLNMIEGTNSDVKDLLNAMDSTGVDKAILRVPIWEEWLTLDLCKRINDSMAECVREHSDRFLGLAMVPPWGDEECLNELERCVKDLGLCGFEMPAHYGKLYLDEEVFRPHLKKINELNVPIMVHHTPLPVDYYSLTSYTNLRRFYGRCADQMTNLGRILFSGLLDEFPNLKFVPTMLGGCFFAYADILALSRRKSTVRENIERFDLIADKVRGYLERNIYFDITHAPPWGEAQLECAVKVLGADHILWGSSYPLVREWMLKGVEYMDTLDISDKERSLIMGENAAGLFNIKA